MKFVENVFYSFIFGCAGSALLCAGFLSFGQAAATLELQYMGFSLWWLPLLRHTGSRAHRLQELQLRSLVALQYVESSQTRDRTYVP